MIYLVYFLVWSSLNSLFRLKELFLHCSLFIRYLDTIRNTFRIYENFTFQKVYGIIFLNVY